MVKLFLGHNLVGSVGVVGAADGLSVPEAISYILARAGYPSVASLECLSGDRLVVTFRDRSVVNFSCFVW